MLIYPLVTSHRFWFVPDFLVWGASGLGELDLLIAERHASTTTIYFNTLAISGGEQRVAYNQLIDHRGNTLPTLLKSPRVIPRARQDDHVYIIGTESPSQFTIARDPDATSAVLCDLLIIELGD